MRVSDGVGGGGAAGSQQEPRGERIVGVEEVLRGAGDPGPARDRRYDRGTPADRRLLGDAPDEAAADERLVDELLAGPYLAAGMQLGEPCRRAGAAGRPVEP